MGKKKKNNDSKKNGKEKKLIPEEVKTANSKKKRAFYRALDGLHKFFEENDGLMTTLRSLVADYNKGLSEYKDTLRDVAIISENNSERAGRDKEFLVSKKVKTEFDIDPLLKHVTVAVLEKNHAVIPRTVYEYDEDRLFMMVGAKLIPDAAFRQAIKKIPQTPAVRCPSYGELKI